MKNKELDKKLDDIIEKLETILSIIEKQKSKNESPKIWAISQSIVESDNGLFKCYKGPSIPPRNIQEA